MCGHWLALWIDKPLVENLKKIATNTDIMYPEQQKAIETIGEVGGYGAELALSEIANDTRLMYWVREHAMETLKRKRR